MPGAASGGGTTLESKRERVLKALYTALNTTRPAGSTLLRNAVLPERIPAAGLMILRDGDPGEPQFLFSPPLWFYEHRAEIDVLVDAASPAARDTAFDGVCQAISRALSADPSLGGLVDYALGEAPAPLDLAIEGAEGLKAASIGIILPYDTSDPLA
nr:acyl-CoA transferase [uncultured Amaricoccus sp.]